ncbi:hypothetical protein RAG91_25860, partial [Klebsiella pneumoniae]
TVCVVGKMRDLILQLSKSSIYSTKPDEATSHLDLKNESAINQSIASLSITRIIVAHRPSTIASADRIIDLSQYGKQAS